MTSRKASILGLLCLIFLQMPPTASAQYTTDGVITGGEASGTLYSAVMPLAFPRSFLFARGDFGERPGVEDNFFTFGGFMPMQFHGPDEVFFLEGSAWISENDSSSVAGGTFGIGNRWMIADYSQVIGINAFAAWDQSQNGHNYDGASIGVEWLSDYLGVTANAYFPWNNDRINAVGPVTLDKDSLFFTGSNLAFRSFQPVEEQSRGADIEVGSPIPRAEWLSVYAGGYYFDAEEGNEFSGVSGRIQIDMTNALVSLTVSNDDRFGTTVNLGGELRLGDGPLNFAPRSRNLDRQTFDRVRRRSRIVINNYVSEGSELALKPDDGSGGPLVPYEFLHVDNTAAAGGDGSFLLRFDELNDASNIPAADVILVYQGSTSFGGDHLASNGGLFLEDNQIVVGEGYDGFTLEFAQFPGQQCPIPFGGAGTNPFIEGNLNANIINLADNNRILGLNLLPNQNGMAPINVGNAIFGSNISVNSSTAAPFIDHVNSDIDLRVTQTGSGGGIRLENVEGVAVITDSGFNIDNTTASGGVVVENTNTADLSIMIDNDTATLPGLAYIGGTAGVSLTGDNSNITALIDGVVNSGSENGLVQIASNTGNVDIAVTNSAFTNSAVDSYHVEMDGGTGMASLTNTSLEDATEDAIDIFATDAGNFTLSLTNSSGDFAGDNGVLIMAEQGSTVNVTSTGSTFDRDLASQPGTGDGLNIDVQDGSIVNGTFTNGSFDFAGGNAVTLNVVDNGSIGLLNLINTSGENAGVDAININAADPAGGTNAVATVVLANSTEFSGAGEDGLEINNDGATVNVAANSDVDDVVDFSNFGAGSGLNSFSTGAGAMTGITFTDGANFDNVAMNSAIDAIFIESNDGASTTLLGSEISGENAGEDGINLISDGGTITATITAAGSFAGAGQNAALDGDGLDIDNSGGGNITLNLAGNLNSIVDFSGAADNGLLSAADGANTVTTLNFNTGADLSMVGLDAINASSTMGAVNNINGVNMVGTFAGDNALELFADGTDSQVNINFLGTNDFSDAALNGILSNNSDGGLIDVAIGNADFSDLAVGQVAGTGLSSTATGANTSSTFTFNTGADFNDVNLNAILLDTSNGASNTLLGAGLSGVNAGLNGIEIANAGATDSTTTVTLTGSNDFSGATLNGLLSNNTAGDVNVNIGDADFSAAAGGSGISSTATGDTADSTFTFNTGANFNDAGVNAITLSSTMGGTNTLTGDSVSGANAAIDAINLNADGTGSDIDLTLTNSTDFTNSGEDGLDFTATDMANIDINLSGVDALNPINFDDTDTMEAGFGVLGNVTDASASLTLNNASFDETDLGGLQVNATNSTFNANIQNTTFNNSNGTGVEFNLNNVTGNPIVLNTVEAMMAGQQTTNGAANALTLNILGGGSNEFDIDGFNGDNAFNNGFEINVDAAGPGGSTLTFDLDNSSFADAGRNAAEWNALNNSVIESSTGATFDSVDLSGAGLLGAAVTMTDDGDALQINSMMMSRVGFDTGMLLTSNIKIDNSDLSGAAGSAMDFMLDGTSEVNVHVDPTDLTGAGGNGVEFDVLGSSTLNLQITDGSHISTDVMGETVGENGIFGLVTDGSTASVLVQDSNIANDSVLGGDFSAIDITTTVGSTLNLDINNVDMSGWSDAGQTIGSGIILDVDNSTANVNISGTGTDISGAGVNAIDIEATTGATVNLDLGTDGLILDGAGNTGLVLVADDSLITVDGDDVSSSGNGNLGFDLIAENGGQIDLTGADNLGIDGWTADGNLSGGLSIIADGTDSEVFGVINNLTTINSGAAEGDDAPPSFGIGIFVDNGAEIGTRPINSAGLIFNGTVSGTFDAFGNPDFTAGNITQDHGLILDVDNGSFAGVIFNNSQFDANDSHGAVVRTNGDGFSLPTGDTALASILFNAGTINNNGGHGVLLESDGADVSTQATTGQSGGINARFQDMFIQFNSDAIAQEVTPGMNGDPAFPDDTIDGNNIGFGVFAQGDATPMTMDPGLINVNFSNTTLAGNEEGEFGSEGTIINSTFNNMTFMTPLHICADVGDMTLVFNDVTLRDITGNQAAISVLAANGFTADVTFNNFNIIDVEAQAVALLSETGGNIIADFNLLTIDNAGYGDPSLITDDPAKTNLALEGVIQGEVRDGAMGSSMDVSLSGVTILDSGDGPGMGINVNAIDFQADGVGATLNLDISPDALSGLTIINGATTAGNEGGMPADEGEIDVELTNGAIATINLEDINIDGSDSLGIQLTDDGDPAGGFIINNLDDIQANNSAQTGFDLDGNIIVGAPATVTLSNSSFNNAGQGMNAVDAVNIDVTSTGNTDFTFDTVTGNNAGGNGLDLNVDGLIAGANASVNILGSSFNGASGGDGIQIDLGGDAASTGDVTITNTSATGAMNDGINITSTTTDITFTSIGDAMDMVDVSGAGGDGFELNLTGQAVPTDVTIQNLNANDAGLSGIDINLTSIDGGDSTVSITNSSADTSGTSTASRIDITMTDVNFSGVGNAGTQTILIDNVSAQGNPALMGVMGRDGLNIDVTGLDGNETLDLIIGNGSNFSNNQGGGADLNASGVVGTTINLDIDGLTVDNNLGGDGLNFASDGENINIQNLANLSSTGNALDGIDFTFDGGSTVDFVMGGTFNGLSAQNNQQSGLVIDVLDGSTLNAVTFDNIDLSGNGQGGQGFDGLDIQVHDAMSSANFTFNNLTINNSGGRGIDLDVYDSGTLTFNVDNSMGGGIDSSGRQGLDINVGALDEDPAMPATPMGIGLFTGTFTGLDISNSGQFPTTTSDGVNVLVTNAGSMATITFDDVSSNSSDEDGFDIDILDGATATVNVQNGTEAMNNAAGASTNVGLSFTADGAATTASLIMDGTMAPNNFSNNEDEGIIIQLTNGVTADTIQVDAIATNNGSDGIRIEANDFGTTMVQTTINNLNINNAQADNNMGNGLFVDLFNVAGITDLDFSDATFTGNQGDQVFFGLREQDLTTLNVENVNVVGAVGSGDGIEFNLIDSNITDTLSIRNLTATGNGERGLNFILDESVIYDGMMTSSINVGFITESEFANNGLAGARIQVGGESMSDFDIYENTVGFHDNTGIGLNIQIQDTATFTIEGDNVNAVDPMNPEQSFYNNTFADNGSFGVLFEASEPDDNDPLDFDEALGGPPTLGPSYTLELGDPNRNPNNITGNQNAALALIASNDSVGSFEITNSILTTTGNMGTDARFNGDGLAVFTEDRAEILALTLDGSSQLDLNNNAGSGLFTSINDNSMLGTVSRLDVKSTTIMGNQMHGIDIQRDDNALYGPDTMSNRVIIGGLTDAEGNSLIGNQMNGLNIDNDNTTLTPEPLDLQVRSNLFMNNVQDGIFTRATADAVFTGRFSDNRVMGNGDNGIRIVLENDSGFGNSDLGTNPAGTPFLLDGNQITMNGFDAGRTADGGNGIFFDTNFTNEVGNFGGRAYVNALIQDSATRDDQFGVSVRTLISGNAVNGIQIIDNSEFLGNFNTATAQNTYDIRGTDITMNGANGIFGEQGERTLPGGPSGGADRDANNGFALLLGRDLGTSEFIGKRDVVISGNNDDGIDLELRDGDSIANLFELDLVTIQNNGANGDNHRNELGPQNVGHGIEIEVGSGNSINLGINEDDEGRIIANFNNVDILSNAGDGMDWIVSTSDRVGNIADVTMFDVNSSMNGGRGADISIRHDIFHNTANAGGNSSAFSNWRIGRGDMAAIGANDLSLTNQFNSNGREGIVFDISAEEIDNRDVPRGGTYPNQSHVDISDDVFVEVNLPALVLTGLDAPSTKHGVYTGEDVNGDGVLEPSEDVNMNGMLDPGEDTNMNGMLDPGEDVNMNGILDPPEDTNMNGILDLGEDVNMNGMLDHQITSRMSNGTVTDPFTNEVPVTMGEETILDIDGTGVHVQANIQVVNTEISSNGGFGGFEDGLDIAVGSLTRANVVIGNSSFGGNRGTDIRIYPQQSYIETYNAAGVATRTGIDLPDGNVAGQSSYRAPAGSPDFSYLVYDPVAYIDLAFGIVDSTGGWSVDTTAGNGQASNSGTGGIGRGDQVDFISFGTSQTDQITFDGRYTKPDQIRIVDNRPVYLAGVVVGATESTFTSFAGGSDDNTNNVFIDGGVQQDINAFFNGNPFGTWITYPTFTPDPDNNGIPDTTLPIDNALDRIFNADDTDSLGY